MDRPKYLIKYQGETFVGNSVDAVAHSISKQFGIEYTRAVIFVNKNIIPIARTNLPEFNPQVKKKLTLDDILNGAKAVLKNAVGLTVEQPVINQRAVICSNCPKCSDVSICVPCGGAKKIVKFVNFCKQLFTAPNYIIPNNLDRSYCKACDCALAVMLPAKLEDFSASERVNPIRPSFCWVKKGI